MVKRYTTEQEFFQIRINKALKERFFEMCHQESLRPSEVVRQLIYEYCKDKAKN